MDFELFHLTILNGIGGACLRASRFQAIFHTIITECAFMSTVIAIVITHNHPERTGDDAIATPITDILLYIDCIKLCTNKCPCRTCFLARRMGTVFAYITMHQPAFRIEERQRRSWRGRRNSAIAPGLSYFVINVGTQCTTSISPPHLLNKLDMSPGDST